MTVKNNKCAIVNTSDNDNDTCTLSVAVCPRQKEA